VNLNTIASAYRRLQKEGLIRIRHGSGAIVISRKVTQKAEEQLQAQLRAALTQLVLSGLARTEITVLVSHELDRLFRGRLR
jgi:DNA-binding transcriptional regulator YhcF (GntR family)